MTTVARRLPAAIYCRLSLARDGDTTKVDDQARICRQLCEGREWDVFDVYSDNNKSAWHHDRHRPEWERMLADVEAGHVRAIVVYHGDRLIRQPWDLEMLLNLARGKGIRLASPTGERDLDSAEDQFVLSIEAAMARRESANISRRQKARFDRWRRDGKVMAGGPGGRRFGFASDGVTHLAADRCEVAGRREVTEADIVREMARRTIAGESAGAIVTDLAARGWASPAAKPLDRSTLKRILRNPRYAGLMPDGETKAAWEPVLDRETWERARMAVDRRAGAFPRGTHPARWLLSGIACCGRCGRPMRIAHITSGDRAKGRSYKTVVYACSKRDRGGCGKVYRNAAHLDAWVSVHTVARLNSPLNPQARVPAADFMPEWTALAGERADVEAALADYRGSAGRTRLLMRRLDSIDARITELRGLEAANEGSRLLADYRGITLEEFRALPLPVSRALVSSCLRVTVLPASGRGPGFRTEDVRLEPL